MFNDDIEISERMAQLLRARGYETQTGLFGGVYTIETIPVEVWNECAYVSAGCA